uniref:Uncharacterized protein n=1 Tax=Arundo donax TaxID=35708 RepID=A0A0A8ZGR5_ARUDO
MIPANHLGPAITHVLASSLIFLQQLHHRQGFSLKNSRIALLPDLPAYLDDEGAEILPWGCMRGGHASHHW